MKTLIILRHGKSSWDDSTLRDFDRPLLNKGKRRTQLIADHLKVNSLVPELIISSPAVRAYETAVIAALNLNYNPETIQKNDNLYFVNTEKYFEAVYSSSDEINTLMIVGHNPMITDFCNYFLTVKINNLPTSGLAVFKLLTDTWEETSKCSRTTEQLLFPKMLEQQ
jgi:phosphohistidine phosphatase